MATKKKASPAKNGAVKAKARRGITRGTTAVRRIVSADVAEKKAKKASPKMKKMVPRSGQGAPEEDLFENSSKDFAFAFAESMKDEQFSEAAKKPEKSAADDVKLTKRPTTRAKGSATLKFPDADLAQFRKALVALRHSIVGKTATLKTNALEQTIDRAGEDEDGSDSFMRLQNLGQVGEQNKTLQKIDEALHRIDDGTYGICSVCGQLIRKARLQHLPFAHTCMECQREMEARPDSIA